MKGVKIFVKIPKGLKYSINENSNKGVKNLVEKNIKLIHIEKYPKKLLSWEVQNQKVVAIVQNQN